MKELLNETGVPIKNPGDGLSHKDINSINIAVNNVIEAENFDLINFCNINQEQEEFSVVYTFREAVSKVPESRRKQGIVVRYLSEGNRYREIIFNFIGPVVTESDWLDERNWSLPFKNIDGGEWAIEDDF